MSSPSAPPLADPTPPPVPNPPDRPRHVQAAWPVWRERGLGLAFVGAGVVLWLGAERFSAAQQGVLWAALSLALLFVVRVGWLPLVGPVFGYDLMRTSRRGRYAVLRCVYAVALFLFILALYRAQSALDRNPWMVGAGSMSHFAELFCYSFLAAQFVAVVALTPAYVAGAVAEERERKTLEFLLATDLRDREIILGKMAARVLNLILLLLTGLPILSLTQLWGGVDFGVLISAFALTGVTLLSLAAVSILASVHARTAREAVVLAYLIVAGYVGVTVLVHLLNLFPRIAAWPVTWGASPYTVKDAIEFVTAGNTGLLCLGLRDDLRTGVTLPAALAARMGPYVVFQLIVTLVFTSWAVLRFRVLALADGPVKAKPPAKGRRRRWSWRASVGRRALLWKEVWAEPGLTFNWFGKAILLLIVLVSLIPAVWLIADFCLAGVRDGFFGFKALEMLGHDVNIWVRIVGTLVALLTLLGVAVRAASSISGEHDRQTFDSLLTAPVESNSILFAKWVGSILSVRRAWLWLVLVWLVGGVTGGLDGPAIPWLFLAWGVYAGFLAVLGLWFSMTCRTTLRATVGTLLTAAVLGVGHWYLWLVFCLPLRLREDTFAAVVRFQMYGLTPPFALGWLAFRGDDLRFGVVGSSNEDPIAASLSLFAGLVLWSVAGYVLWRVAARRFRVLTGRAPIPVPVVGQDSNPVARPTGLESCPTPRRPRRRLRLLMAGIVGLALLVVTWGIFRALSADRHLNEALEATTETDPGWRLADIEAARTPIPDDQNSIPVILPFRGLSRRWHAVLYQELTKQLDELPPQVRLSGEQRRGITDDLEEVEAELAHVAPLADLPRGRYTLAWSRDFWSTLVPHIDAQHPVRRLLWHDLMLCADEGDADGALLDCRRLLHLGSSLGDEPLLVSQSVRNNAACNAVRGVQRVLAQGEPTPEALADLQQRLAAEEAHPGLLIGLRGERACMDGLMALIQSGEMHWQNVNWFAATEDYSGRYAKDTILFSLTPGAEKESRAALLRHYAALIDAAKRPCEEQGPALARLDAEGDDMPVLARQLNLHGAKICDRFRRGRAELRCAIVALAAERFRRRHQRWPQRLEELVPDFLAQVPADPFDGAPLRLRRLPDGLVIYSVGPDGHDDDGDVQGLPDQSKNGKDVGFRLWDVGRRRQEPAGAALEAPGEGR